MRFWDASAVVPLCFPQPAAATVRRLTAEDPAIRVWWGTPVEVRSAVARLLQAGTVPPDGATRAVAQLARLRGRWLEIIPSDRVRAVAEELPGRYGLRAADALQLAAALVWCDERPRDRGFVCLDRRLADAAAHVGFDVMPR